MMIPKNRNIRMLVETTLSFEDGKEARQRDVFQLFAVFAEFPCKIYRSTKHRTFVDGRWQSRRPSVKSCVASTVRLENTDQ